MRLTFWWQFPRKDIYVKRFLMPKKKKKNLDWRLFFRPQDFFLPPCTRIFFLIAIKKFLCQKNLTAKKRLSLNQEKNSWHFQKTFLWVLCLSGIGG